MPSASLLAALIGLSARAIAYAFPDASRGRFGADQASPNSHRQTVLRSLHQALHAMQVGDFSIRLAIAGEGIEAKISLRATSPLRSNSNRSGYSAAMGNGIGPRPI